MGTEKKKGFYLALFATLLAMVVVVLGAYTRLVHAGLGCPDWPGCYGMLTVPGTPAEIAAAESLYPDTPVEVDKGWPEMIHRYVAGLLLLTVLCLAQVSFKHRKEAGQPVVHAFLILGLIIVQAAFGMWTVTLKLWPQVVTLHLLGGFATFALLFLLMLRLSRHGWKKLPQEKLNSLKRFGSAALLVVVLQITLGGWISSNYAALACPDLPGCQGQWLPQMDFSQGFDITQEIGPNYLGGQMDSAARTAIHFTHRVGAILTLLVLIVLSARAFKYSRQLSDTQRERGSFRKMVSVMLVMLLIQVALGLSNIIWHLPLPVAVAHNLVGALLLLTVVAFNYRLRISGG